MPIVRNIDVTMQSEVSFDDGCGGRAGRAELLTGIDGASSRPVQDRGARGLMNGARPLSVMR